jgi:hypothetical protein
MPSVSTISVFRNSSYSSHPSPEKRGLWDAAAILMPMSVNCRFRQADKRYHLPKQSVCFLLELTLGGRERKGSRAGDLCCLSHH